MTDQRFEGLTQEYRASSEYQSLLSMVKQMNPELPEYMCELVIAFHKQNPLAYRDKNLHKLACDKKASSASSAQNVYDTVKILDVIDPDERENKDKDATPLPGLKESP